MIRVGSILVALTFASCASKPPPPPPAAPTGYVIDFKPAPLVKSGGSPSKLQVSFGTDKKTYDLAAGCRLFQDSSENAVAFFTCPAVFEGALYTEDFVAVDLASGKPQSLLTNILYVVTGAPKDVLVAVRNKKPLESETNERQLVAFRFDPKTQKAKVDRVATGDWLPSMNELELTSAEEGSARLEKEYKLRARIDGRTLKYRKSSNHDWRDYAL